MKIKEIPGYEGFYGCSKDGVIWSLKRKWRLQNRPVKSFINHNGYLRVRLSKNKVTKSHRVHRLIALTFVPNPNNKPQVNHKNGIKIDNRIENLEWMTCSEDMKHAWQCGLRTEKNLSLKWLQHQQKKLTVKQANEIRHLYATKQISQDKIASIYRVSQSRISAVIYNKY